MRIAEIRVTQIAVPDVPLANTKGVHSSDFLRSVIELRTECGHTGLGETYGAARTLNGLRTVAPTLEGLDPLNLHDLRRRAEAALPGSGRINAPTAPADHKVVDAVYSAFEIGCLDLQGQQVGRPLHDLLGGAFRDTASFGGCLFFKFAKRDLTFGPDILGEVTHSNSHLGISLAAMIHVAAATPNLIYDGDTQCPWASREIVKGGRPAFVDGSLPLPTAPGLGVQLDTDAAAELHELYKRARVVDRDDTDEMLKYVPDYIRKVP